MRGIARVGYGLLLVSTMSSRLTTAARNWIWATCALAVLGGGAYWIHTQRTPPVPTIAFIPQTAGVMRWDVGYFGASVAAKEANAHISMSAPTSENDIAGQISLINRVVRGDYQGLIVAPNHPLAILSSLGRALAEGVPVVVVSSPLTIPANGRLGYIENDDEEMGKLAAEEIAKRIEGRGDVAFIGLSWYAPGVTQRARGADRYLANRFPEIRVVSRVASAYNPARAEELANETMDAQPRLKAILSLTSVSTRGVNVALRRRHRVPRIQLVGCEQDSDLLVSVRSGEIAAVVAEDTYRMGHEAVEHVSAFRRGAPIPKRSLVSPIVITPQNLDSHEVRRVTNPTQ